MRSFFGTILLMLLPLSLLCSCGESGRDAATRLPESIGDLAGKRPAVLNGSLQDVEMDHSDFRKDMIRLQSVTDMILSLKSGNSDFFLIDSVCAISAGFPEKGIACAFNTTPAGHYGMAFRKTDTELADSFNEFLADLKADGTYDDILRKWIKGDVATAAMPQIVENADRPPLVVGTSSLFPFSFVRDGSWVGFDIELVVRFANSIGREVVILNIDFSGLIAALVSGKIDMIANSLTISEERAKSVLFSDGYYYAFTGCFVRAGDYGVDVMEPQDKKPSLWKRMKDSFVNNFVVEDRYKLLLDGVWETIVLSIFSILFGTLFGAFLCYLKFSRFAPVRGVVKGFCTLMDGLPILVILMIMFYIVFATAGISPRWVAIIAFSMNFGATVSSILFSGINAIDKGQTEGGLALGFSSIRTFLNFVFPQAVRNVMPLYKGEAVSLVKMTSVVGYIAIQDLTKVSDIIRSRTFDAFFPLIVISVIYFILAWLFGLLMDVLAKKI